MLHVDHLTAADHTANVGEIAGRVGRVCIQDDDVCIHAGSQASAPVLLMPARD